VLSSGLPGRLIVLEGFVGKLFISEPGSAQEVEEKEINQHLDCEVWLDSITN
jgi:hypothetical protein